MPKSRSWGVTASNIYTYREGVGADRSDLHLEQE